MNDNNRRVSIIALGALAMMVDMVSNQGRNVSSAALFTILTLFLSEMLS
jgi:hypothetical protein